MPTNPEGFACRRRPPLQFCKGNSSNCSLQRKGPRRKCRPWRPQRRVCGVIFIKSHFSKVVPPAFILVDVNLEKLSTRGKKV